MNPLRFRKTALCVFTVLLGVLSSCDPTKKLSSNQYIVERVEVVNAQATNIPRENFEAFYRQKPNRKLFRKVQFFVWWYHLFNEQKINTRKQKRDLKYDRINANRIKRAEKKNEKRARKGKPRKEARLKDKDSPIFIESIRDIGEPPVIYDSSLTKQTNFQLSKYLFSKGYFNNSVADSVRLTRKSQRAIIKYHLRPGPSYTVNSISYDLKDKNLGELILKDTINSLLRRGMQYDEEKFQAERQRLTDLALNNGYFYFENAFISYTADTNAIDHSVAMKIRLRKFSRTYSSSNDSVIEVDHPQFRIANVYVITEQLIGNPRDYIFRDTIVSRRKDITFLMNKPLAYKRRIILANTDIYKGQYYRKDSAQQTYKQLLGLGIFKNVTIQFLVNQGNRSELDCYIICNPLLKQSLTAETEGTNTSGNLGIDGSLVYQNRNVFKGGELIEIKLQGAVAAQKPLNSDEGTIQNVSDVNSVQKIQKTFNTIQFGPQISFSVPRALFPFSLLPFRKNQEPRTFVKSSLNYQTRPEFSRVISNIDYGFSFKTYNRQLRHDIVPLEVYLVRANLLDSYTRLLQEYNDAFLLNSFQDHITTLSKYSIAFTSKENSVTGKRAAYYAKLNLQSSGNLLRLLYKAAGRPSDSLDRYLIFNIPFAQFLKADIDLRMYLPIRNKSRVVYRIAAGIGKPLTNLSQLPYEQSFFSGGPNSVRAWRARTLGPGGYDPRGNPARFDKIGDILLEGNIEYRFHIIRSFYGALFVDAGNIWRLSPDDSKPNGEFRVATFADQIAIGGGMGIRWDLTFFVLRLDIAAPLKDPKFAPGNRWTFDKQGWEYSVINFGIGYPF